MIIEFSKFYIIFFTVIILFIGCTDNYKEINTDPLSLTLDKVDESLIGLAFAQAQYFTINGVHWRYQVSQNVFSDLYCQYFATTQPNFPNDRYMQLGKMTERAWNSFYSMAAPNIKYVEEFTAEHEEFTIENAIAKVWKVYGYHRITDYWGPVIYTHFGNGKMNVPYDQQEDIYKSFFPILDEAVDALRNGGEGFSMNDQIFNGDASLWLKFAGSLRLRLAMRLKYVDAEHARREAEKAIHDGVMEMNSDNASLVTTDYSPNPINTITNWGEFRMSAAMESILKGYMDPRMPVYFSPALEGDSDGDGIPYEGLRNGQSIIAISANQNSNYSNLGPTFLPSALKDNNAIKVIRCAESYFLRAEGALVGWDMGMTAQDAYEEGIRMSMKEWTAANDSIIDAYISSKNIPASVGDEHNTPPLTDIPVAYLFDGNHDDQLEQIITQKWLALYPDGWEAWAELRRTKYPTLYDRLYSDNVDVGIADIMARIVYVTSEFNTNKNAVDDAITSPEIDGADKGSTKVWWDKK
jgi:hypothetical protein